MRLINIHSLALEEYMPDVIPSFAILSHTWEAGEVSYGEMMNSDRAPLKDKQGYQKIVSFCEYIKNGLDANGADTGDARVAHAWVDTCCIDKTSSAELSEAINSMYGWYAMSQYCVAYLGDHTRDLSGSSQGMENSRWYTRGWTLQELLAPRNLLFVDKNWEFFGTKLSLASQVSEASGIDRRALVVVAQPYSHANIYVSGADVFEPSIATRMSWAAKRTTTRPEDMAYCLMGLFQVNMPLLYGEGGERAFIRLQEEIIKESDDQSIFVWNPSSERASSGPEVYLGALAVHPSEFAESSDCELDPSTTGGEPHSVTSRGIKIDLDRIRLYSMSGLDGVYAILQCQNTVLNNRRRYGIPMRRLSGHEHHHMYSRDVKPVVLLDSTATAWKEASSLFKKATNLLKRTKVHFPRALPIVEVVIWDTYDCAGRWRFPFSRRIAVYYEEKSSPKLHKFNLPEAGRHGVVPLGDDGKATIVIECQQRGRSGEILREPFILGIERNATKSDVKLALTKLDENLLVKDEDLGQLHTDIHRMAEQDKARAIWRGRSPGWQTREGGDALVEALTSYRDLEDGQLGQRCQIEILSWW